MEAIAELIAATFLALFEAFLSFVVAVCWLIAILLEFVCLAAVSGLDAAKERYRSRRDQRRAKREVASADDAGEERQSNNPSVAATRSDRAIRDESDDKQISSSSTKQSTQSTMSPVVLKLVAVGTVGGIVAAVSFAYVGHVRKTRIAATESQVDRLAGQYIRAIKRDADVELEAGALKEGDSWGQPLELFVDRTLIGSMVVVRSNGPDKTSGTVDDLLGIRTTGRPAKDVGGEIAKRGWNAVKDRLAKALPKKRDANADADVDNQAD